MFSIRLSSRLRHGHEMHFNWLALTYFATTWCHFFFLRHWQCADCSIFTTRQHSTQRRRRARSLERWLSLPRRLILLSSAPQRAPSPRVPASVCLCPEASSSCSSRPPSLSVSCRGSSPYLARLAPPPEIKCEATAAPPPLMAPQARVLISEGNAGAFRWV